MTQTPHITLSELQLQIKESLVKSFELPIWVVAEISELKVNYSGHCYLELTEKGENSSLAKALVRGVIWRTHYPRIEAYFKSATGQELAPGLKVLLKATVNYHELYGLSLQISDIDPSYTMGELEQQRQATIERLKREGVWDMNRELHMPIVVQRIAVLSSRNAAGYQDFVNELKRGGYHFRLTLYDSVMQGENSEASLISALHELSESLEEYDAVVIIRGGGSTSDLNSFNSYTLCTHIAQFPLPIITGIGHDKDVSVADMVAHSSLKTPTAVAGWLISRMQDVEAWLESAALSLHDFAIEHSRSELIKLERYSTELKSRCESYLQREALLLSQLHSEIKHAAELKLDRERVKLKSAEELCESHSPQRILKLGFSILRHRGKAQTSTQGLNRGDIIEIELSNGRLNAIVDKKES